MLFAKVKVTAIVVLTLGIATGGFTAGYQQFTVRAEDEKGKSDKERLLGAWKLESGEQAGKAIEGKELDEIKERDFIFKADTVIARHEVKYTIEASKQPKQIELDVTEGPERERGIWRGIYELKGDDLTICLAMPNLDRPDKFETKEGVMGVMLMKFKRAK